MIIEEGDHGLNRDRAPPGQISRSLAQDLVGLPKLPEFRAVAVFTLPAQSRPILARISHTKRVHRGSV